MHQHYTHSNNTNSIAGLVEIYHDSNSFVDCLITLIFWVITIRIARPTLTFLCEKVRMDIVSTEKILIAIFYVGLFGICFTGPLIVLVGLLGVMLRALTEYSYSFVVPGSGARSVEVDEVDSTLNDHTGSIISDLSESQFTVVNDGSIIVSQGDKVLYDLHREASLRTGFGMTTSVLDYGDVNLGHDGFGTETVGDGLIFRDHPSSADYGKLEIRGRQSDFAVNYVGKVYVGKQGKFVGYGVFIGVFFVTLTSLTSGCDIVVCNPIMTVRPYLWKSNSGFAIYYVGVSSPLRITVDDSVTVVLGIGTTVSTDEVCLTRYSMHDALVNIEEDYIDLNSGVSLDAGLLLPGLPMFIDKHHVRGLYIGNTVEKGLQYMQFNDSVETIFGLREAPIILSRKLGYHVAYD